MSRACIHESMLRHNSLLLKIYVRIKVVFTNKACYIETCLNFSPKFRRSNSISQLETCLKFMSNYYGGGHVVGCQLLMSFTV